MAIDDERLMAYADGALSSDEAAEVERAIATDEALATKVAAFADSRTLAKRALGTAQPVSEALVASIRAMSETGAQNRHGSAGPAQVIDLASRRRTVPFWQLPIAASVALAVGAFGGWFGKPQTNIESSIAVAAIDEPAFVNALATVKSGERAEIGNGAAVTAVSSFRSGDGKLCRELEHDRGGDIVVAVACRDDAVWSIRFAIASAARDDAGYVPASSLDTLDTWLSSIEAGAPMSDEDEAAALATLR